MSAEVTDLVEEGAGRRACAAATPEGHAGDPRRLHRGRRRPPLDGARARPGWRSRIWARHRRALDAALPRPSDPTRPWPVRPRPRHGSCIDRGDYWQCGYVIPKGGRRAARGASAPSVSESPRSSPFLARSGRRTRDWDDVKLLTVALIG